MRKFLKTSGIREIHRQWVNAEISASRAVEIINEMAYEYYKNITPIHCSKTKAQLFIGDKVEDSKGNCGTLYFDDYSNKYVIRTESGGNIHTSVFKKIEELHENHHDTTRVECRPANAVNKTRW